MNDEFDGSFKIYVDAHPKQEQQGGNDPHVLSQEVENVKEDLKSVEKLYEKLQEYNEEIKRAEDAKTMKEVRGHLNADLDYLVKLAKQIEKKFDALVRANAALRMNNKNGDEMVREVREKLSQMMRKFQGMRTHTEIEHRQLIESRYYAVTKQKATAEAIGNLIANVEETAMQEHLDTDTVAEIQERRDTMMEIRKNLMLLHQILLGMSTPDAPPPLQVQVQVQVPVDDQIQPPNKRVVVNMPNGTGGGGKIIGGGGMASSGGLNDYERETRNQAYIAICIALILIISLTVLILYREPTMETAGANMSQTNKS